MAKTKVTPLELAEKYLLSIGVSKTILALKLLPAKFSNVVYCKSLIKSNVVVKNKAGLGSHESHIAIDKQKWPIIFKAADIADYEATGNRHETLQTFELFEANISSMLTRRSISTSTLVKNPVSSKGTYAICDTIIQAAADKWIDSNNGSTQVRLSQSGKDSNEFIDFRLGIQIGDYLIMLQDKFTENILAISIPAEFAQKYDLQVAKPSAHKTAAKAKAKKETEQRDDDDYVRATENSTEITLPAGPQPPVKASFGKTGKTYKARPGIGKNALKNAGYVCECNPTMHTTFIARSTGNNYMEPHHLVPISKQGLFPSAGLDVPENIICLCPTCHSKIHYGEKADIKSMLHIFLIKRSASLASRGIIITESELFALYDL